MAEKATEQGTKHIRLSEDTAKMVSELAEVHNTTAAGVIDDIARVEIERRHKIAKPVIDRLNAAKVRAKRAAKALADADAAFANSHDTGGEG